jgi:hypothetical protein
MSDSILAQRAAVLGLSELGVLQPGPIIDGIPWPELVADLAAQKAVVLKLSGQGVLHQEPIIDGMPWPELVHDLSPLG